jgi:methionyl-tRNA formyltransferase
MHFIDPGIDTGDIIAQTLLPISDTDNAWTLYERATEAGFELFHEYFLAFLRGEAPRTPQSEAESSYFSVGYPYDRWIDWSQSATQVDRFVRALTFPPHPYPSARTSLAGSEVEVLQPTRPVETSIDAAPGTILTIGEVLTVATGSGILEISRLRMGGKVVKANEVADRLDLSPGLRFESRDWIALRL